MITAAVILAALAGALATYNRGAGFSWGVPSLPRWAKCVTVTAAAGVLAWSVVPWWGAIAAGIATGAAWSLGHGAGLPLLRREWSWRAFLVMLGTGAALTLPMAVILTVVGIPTSGAVALMSGAIKPACYWWSGRSDDRANAYHAATCWAAMAAAVI